MSQNLDLIISARNTSDAAFKQLQGGLAGVQQEAVKTNAVIASSTDRFGKFADGVGKVSTTLARSAVAFGLPIGPLKMLDDVADVAELGLNNLATSAVGLNAATLGVAGAGLAAGAAFGTWLRTFPAISKAADDAAAALVRLFTAQKDLDAQVNATRGLKEDQKRWAAENEEALKRQVQGMREAGATEQQILDLLDGKRETSREKLIAGLKEEEAARKKNAEEARRAAEAYAKAMEKAAEAAEKSRAAMREFWKEFAQGNAMRTAETMRDFWEEQERQANAWSKGVADAFLAAAKAAAEFEAAVREALEAASNKKAWDMVEEAENGLRASADEAKNLASALDGVVEFLELLGVSANSTLSELITNLAAAAEGAGNLMAGLASGNPAQIIAGITGIASALKGLISSESGLSRIIGGALIGGPIGAIGAFLFGGGPSAADRLAQDIRNLQTAFVNASGGLFVLQEKAARAGVSLEAMWNARTVEEYERAVNRVTAAIQLNEEATRLVEEAMERYGLTIDQMGPRFAAQKLSEQAVRLYQDFRLLIAAGADLTTVITAMGPAINDFVQASLAAGIALPEFMRPAIEEMIRLGLLFDENGEKITDISQLTFTETLEAGVQRLIDKIEDLVDALLGIPNNIDTTIAVRVVQTGGVNTGGSPSNNLPDLDNDPQTPMAEGGWFPYRPGGYPVTVGEAGDEAIIPESKMAGIIAQAMVQAGGGGAGPTVVNVYIGGNRLDGVIQRRIDAGLIRVDG